MTAVPVPDRIAMCAAPHGEHDYWALADPEPGVCLHRECECEPVVFVRDLECVREALTFVAHADYDFFEDVDEAQRLARRAMDALRLAQRDNPHQRAAALDQGEGERP